jgi:hypothetical protein
MPSFAAAGIVGRISPRIHRLSRCPFRIRRRLKGGYLYLVYRKEILGVGDIADVVRHAGTRVGTHGQLVGLGDKVLLGPLRRLPRRLPCRGFRRLRYTSKDLHRIARRTALVEIRAVGLATK